MTHLQVLLANFDDLYERPRTVGQRNAPLGMWQKVVFQGNAPDRVLVAPRAPSNLSSLGTARANLMTVLIPARATGSVCSDFLADASAYGCLMDIMSSYATVEVLYQVFSVQAKRLMDTMRGNHAGLASNSLSRVSPRTVSFWNTKVGGRELLQSIPGVADALPPAVVANGRTDVDSILRAPGMPNDLIVKANEGMGGLGLEILVTTGGSAQRVPLTPRSLKRATVSKFGGKRSGNSSLYLVEHIVGDLATNTSLTADLLVSSGEDVRIIGCTEQILDPGLRYVGCRSLDDRFAPQVLTRCEQLGKSIGRKLGERGYRGLLNIDYIVTRAGEVFVAEMNVRQSAPLDQLLIMERLYGAEWATRLSFICREDLKVTGRPTLASLDRLLSRRIHPHLEVGACAIPLAIYRCGPGEAQASVLCVADDGQAAITALGRVRVALMEG